jgi:hypothetical protein
MANKANNGTFGLLGWVARPPFGKRGGAWYWWVSATFGTARGVLFPSEEVALLMTIAYLVGCEKPHACQME